MRIFSSLFFQNLDVDARHYRKVFKQLGVKNSFVYDLEDLQLISNLPPLRYKSVLVSERAKSFLEAYYEQNAC